MPAALDELLQQALALPDDSKLLLAEELVASVGAAAADIDEELIARRRAEFLSGADVLIPIEDALRQVREELAARRPA
jgi:hypothetical protein